MLDVLVAKLLPNSPAARAAGELLGDLLDAWICGREPWASKAEALLTALENPKDELAKHLGLAQWMLVRQQIALIRGIKERTHEQAKDGDRGSG